MTLLTVVQDVCANVGVTYPTSVFSNIAANRTMQEMLAMANEQAQRIAYDHRDWTKLRSMAQLNGDAVWVPPQPDPAAIFTGTTAFNLPANYKRMLLTSNVWLSTALHQPMRFIPDTDEWLRRRINSATGTWGEWTLLGGKMHIFPAMAAGTAARFMYLDKNCIDLASGGRSDVFQSDSDTFTLDERLLKLSMIWNWKASKGAPYAEDMSTFADAIASVMGRDSPAPILVVGPTLRPTGFGVWGY
jgi:hypothetical protein